MVTNIINIIWSTKCASILHCSANVYTLVGLWSDLLAIIIIIIIIICGLMFKNAVKVRLTGNCQIWGAGSTPVNVNVYSFTARFNTTVTHVRFRTS